MPTATIETKPRFAELPARLTKGAEPNGPDVVATITCETVDADNEVVIASGVDLSRFRKNPVIMLAHAYGKPGEYYPLPVGKALWIRQEGSALIAGIRFARSSAMGREVTGLFEESVLNAFSVGFQSITASPPTKEEKRLHPDWAVAELVHRKWQLLETSVVGIPCNPDALGVYVAKGGKLPPYISIPKHFKIRGHGMDPTADETTPDPADESVTAEPVITDTDDAPQTETKTVGAESTTDKAMDEAPYGYCPKCGAPGVMRERRPDGNDRCANGHTYPAKSAKAMSENSGTDGGYTTESLTPSAPDGTPPSPQDADLEAEHNPAPDTSQAPSNYEVKTGHFVKWDSHDGMHGGCGKCMAVHKSGRVPDVANDADASEDEPHARVRIYKSKGGDSHLFTATTHHVAVKCKMCKRMPMVDGLDGEKTTEPPKKKADKPTPTAPVAEPEQPFTPPPFRTKTQYLASLERKIRAQGDLSPPADEIAEQALAALLGAV